jgi:hypothetical protein
MTETSIVLRCRRCGRALSNPHSKAAGIGPVCYRKEVAEAVADGARFTPEEREARRDDATIRQAQDWVRTHH